MSASRAGRNAEPDSCVLLDRDQPVDDLAALHQKAVHRLVDAVDFLAQLAKVGRRLWACLSWRYRHRPLIGEPSR